MAQFAPRRKTFEQLAGHLIGTIIRPRVEKLASYFSNAKLADDESSEHCVCRFGYCDRFPATTKIELAVEHDQRIENVIVSYELDIMPVFMKYDAYDRLTFVLPLISDASEDERVAQWVDDRLLAFIDTYLQMDRGEEDFEDDVAADPVCGMRIRRSESEAHMDYLGHPYYFCSNDCCERFHHQPEQFVQFKTM